jgi:DNA-directed RNA polymerase specialized sigma24 family protein
VGAARLQRISTEKTAADARVTALLAKHGGALMRVARQASLCQDDAADALQRALEIYLRRLDTVERATEGAWMKVVVRHEAYAIRKARGDCVADSDLDFDTFVPAPERSVEEQVLSGDRVSRSAEALRALKPDEARALMLKAHGLSYEEIGRHCGWTYTKVNRCITEGRRRFHEVYTALESGEGCERFAPALEALAAGSTTSEQLVELRPHLRACAACRATVRELHISKRRRVTLLAPVPLLGWLLDRFGGGSPRPVPGVDGLVVPDGLDHAAPPDTPTGPGPDITDLGGTAIPHDAGLTDLAGHPIGGATGDRVHALARAKHHVAELMRRTANADITTGIQIAASTGGGRIATLGAIVGLCVSSIGAGTVCVVTGVVHAPFGLLRPEPKVVVRKHTVRHRPSARSLLASELASSRRLPPSRPSPTPAPTRQTHRDGRAGRPSVGQDPSQGTTPTSHRFAPISPAPPAQTAEFTPAAAAGAGTQAPPAAPPATGGEEFGP